MTPLLSYALKALLCSGILYAYYHIALRNNRFHHWNRYYLLLATLLSLTAPLVQIPVSGQEPSTFTAYTTRIITLREFILSATPSRRLDYMQLLTGGYALVALLLVLRTLYGCWKIKRLLKGSQVQTVPPYRFVQSRQVKAPFSFFRYVFWNPEIGLHSREGQQILQHELAHVNGRHSVDKLLMELVCAIGWINPFFHLFKREMAMVHEFIADRTAAGQDAPADYAQTILQVTLQTRQLSITNNFFHPPVKRRINMLFTQRSNFSVVKKIIAFPLAAGLIVFISCQQQQPDAEPGVTEITQEEMAKLPVENIASMEVVKDAADPAIIVKTKDRKTYRVKPEKQDKMAAKTDEPAAETDELAPKTVVGKPGPEIFTFVEHPPTYPGGEEELAKYLTRSIRYPREAQEKKISGTIFVQFVVGADGKVFDIKTVGQRVGAGLEEESIRVVSEMPKWNPGRQNGKEVAVMFNLPIRYNISAN